MFSAKRIVLISVLAFMSANAFAKTVSVTDSTLEGAEAKVAQQAVSENASYKIVSALYKNRVYMTAELSN
ncbi:MULTISPECIES: DUF1471 domain-containing protein [Enterobacterales]|jgi:hypothetical protein|uniref:DUF1471 domain-containing protein n=1 Tax=Pantoea brenneri TaxID=472694 RepID=A0A653XPP6_9GAMM|nr:MULTISPECIES: DUF1471 domain-containing protein [Enterobacterales]EGT4277931.1 DUF1471 domain-containing protein [Cronobacter sakazakii]MBD7379833.1 DUF1471 domain-containing protein [Klebsiella pneumoniae]ELC6433803.1 DUF1471 domain-containing protein [Enterobacter hormaechei]ELV3458891.1 DUF1471 domain-containing protein [Enterobacter hormaechei]EME1885617.1 DUF1471 domain-containing protein [Cronobacter sakazakii]